MKIFSITTVFMLILAMVTGCGTPPSSEAPEMSEPLMDFGFAEHIGLAYEDALTGMGVTGEAFKETQLTGYYERTQKVKKFDNEFTEFLLFGKYNGIEKALYGGGYTTAVNSRGDELSELVASLKGMLTERFGEPTTYPGLGNAIGDITDFTGYTTGKLKEEWSVSGKSNEKVVLEIDFLHGETVSVKIIYQVSMIP